MPSETTIILSDEQMRNIAGEAILKAIDSQTRDALVAQALKDLVTRSPATRYGDGKSPLEEAFSSAVRMVAQRIAEEELAKDDKIATEVRSLLADAWAKMQASNGMREALVKKMADGIETAFIPSRY